MKRKTLKLLLIIIFIFNLIILFIFYKINKIIKYNSVKIIENENKIEILLKEKNEKFNIINKKKDFLDGIDFITDDSLTKFVNNKISFEMKSYIPEDLVSIKSEYIYDTKWNWKLREIANLALQDMWKEFKDYFSKKLSVISSYRSYKYQKWIKDRLCPDNLCAKAGYSEHQSWLAVDFFSASNNYTWKNDKKLQKYYLWFKENSHKYGFTNTYQKWLEVDWYEIEPWHWRYVWKKIALYLKEKNITFAEFYKINNN